MRELPPVNQNDAPVAVVTGAARGIGHDIAKRLREDGYRVAIVDRDFSASAPQGWLQIESDLADATSAPRIVEQVERKWGRLDVLVNNAGIGGPHALAAELGNASQDLLSHVFAVNLFAPVRITHEAIALLRQHGRGRVINIGSIFSERPSRHDAAYSMTKSALTAFTRSLALEEGEHGVTSNIIAPGLILTDMHRAEVASQAQHRGVSADAQLEHLRETVPVKRHGTGEDIANLVTWVAGLESSYLTGQTITVDGGVTIG